MLVESRYFKCWSVSIVLLEKLKQQTFLCIQVVEEDVTESTMLQDITQIIILRLSSAIPLWSIIIFYAQS